MRKSLWIISALSVALIFLACQENDNDNDKEAIQEVQSIKVIESSVSWDGDTLPNYPTGTPKISVLRINIPPHTKLAMHKHPIINAGVLLNGELTVTSEDGKTNLLKAGDGIVELVNEFHYGENNGNTTAELVVFYAGDENSPLSISME